MFFLVLAVPTVSSAVRLPARVNSLISISKKAPAFPDTKHAKTIPASLLYIVIAADSHALWNRLWRHVTLSVGGAAAPGC